ncbi:hypothetical protein [Nitrospira sp. Kam-Ns4a]
MRCPARYALVVLALGLVASGPGVARAESPAPSVPWGAIAYPEHERTLTAGLTVNRFTEFDGAGKRYNDIAETSGFNFISASWTERLRRLPGWNTNLTAGVGPTQDGFTRFLQNDVVHKLRNLTPVPVGAKRTATDFMVGGSVTRWTSLLGTREEGVRRRGGGHRLALPRGVRAVRRAAGVARRRRRGLRRRSPAVAGEALALPAHLGHGALRAPLRRERLSGRRTQSWLGQVSIGVGDYDRRDGDPSHWEVELAFTKDYGPTFGARLTFDLLRLYDFWLTRL